MNRFITLLLAAAVATTSVYAQGKLTKEQILAMSTDELSELPLDELMQAVETLGVSSVDELFALIMNKNVSSASKKEESSFTSPLASTVITKDELRMYGATTLEDAFRLIPGMIVTQKTNGVYDIQMRGLNNIPDNNMFLYTENNNVLLMIDGRISHCYAMGALYMHDMPISIEDVARIEVVRGSSSALYGPNAVNGVINIITEKPNDSAKNVSGGAQIGNMGTYIADFGLRKRLNDKVSLGLTVNAQSRQRPTDKLYVIPQKGVYIANNSNDLQAGTTTDAAGLASLIASGTIRDASQGGLYTVDDLNRLKQIYTSDNSTFTFYDTFEPESPVHEMFTDPALARQNFGLNGYLHLSPSQDVRIDLTAGYQNSTVTTTPVGDDYVSFNQQTSKTGYINIDGAFKDLHIQLSGYRGPQNYAVGVPGFKIKNSQFMATADYDIKAGDLDIKPQISYQYVYFEDYTPSYTDPKTGVTEELSGFFNDNAKVTDFSPSLRLDYKKNKFRAIAAIRADKTNIPDKWNVSYQASLNYQFNEKNFLRLVYGHSFRSVNLVNSSADFEWRRTNLLMPEYLKFKGNKDADIMNINNIELGYRVKPSERFLIDSEFFFSKSKDYGALTSEHSEITVETKALGEAITELVTTGSAASLNKSLITRSYLQYANMPFDVKQYGLSLNLDWIVSTKLILKLNANFQHTVIDDYYQYSQAAAISSQLAQAQRNISGYTDDNGNHVAGALEDILGRAQTEAQTAAAQTLAAGGSADDAQTAAQAALFGYLGKVIGSNAEDLDQARGELANASSSDQYLEDLHKDALEGKRDDGFAIYYGLRYNMKYDEETQSYVIGESTYEAPPTSNGHVHKTTPAFYGMLGLIYKPVRQLNISAFANYIGKRTYATKYNSLGEDLCGRFTLNLKVGYKPNDNIEFFLNGNNLLNNHKREFVYSDDLGGLYTIGVNFGI